MKKEEQLIQEQDSEKLIIEMEHKPIVVMGKECDHMLVLQVDKDSPFGIKATRISGKAFSECCKTVGDIVKKALKKQSDVYVLSENEELSFDPQLPNVDVISTAKLEKVDGKNQLTLVAEKMQVKYLDMEESSVNTVDEAIEFMYNVYGVEYLPEPELTM